MARRMLADELGDMLNPAPRQEADPDAAFGEDGGLLHGSDDELAAQLEDTRPSRLRLRAGLDELEGAEYRGKRSSRAALFGDGGGSDGDDSGGSGGEEDEEEDEEEEVGEGGAARGTRLNGFHGAGGSSSDEEGEDDEDEDDEDEDEEDEDEEDEEEGLEGGSGSDGGAPDEAGVRPGQQRGAPRRRRGGGGGSDEEGSEGEGEEDEEDEDGAAADMVARLQQYQADPEMAELEREHAALRETAGRAAADREQRGAREASKAEAVRAQKAIWERALEARILLQRPVAAAGRLPRPEDRAAAAAASEDVRQGYAALMTSCREALDALLGLHSELLQRHPTAAAAAAAAAKQQQGQQQQQQAGAGAKRGRSAAGLGDGEAERAWADVEAAVAAAAPFRDGSLDKWHRRTVLSSGTAALRGGGGLRALQQSVTVQVASLMRDAPRLVARTQLTRALAPRPLCAAAAAAAPSQQQQPAGGGGGDEQLQAESGGGPDADLAAGLGGLAHGAGERDPETFDDGEFYQQLLKGLIEAGGVTGGAGGDLAAARPPKRRKAVDRRASKGRKLRFHVMDKLVGFCAPVELAPPPFAAQLFGNLFGGGGGAGAAQR